VIEYGYETGKPVTAATVIEVATAEMVLERVVSTDVFE
jgi:hypothetical protein